jgi:lipopolysaccharide heptosyltransferase III
LPELQPPASILVINVSRIGDTLLATPALRALAGAWPQARISFLGHPRRVEVVQHLPFLTEVGPITKYRAAWRGRLLGQRWDLALVLGYDKALVSYALRVATRVVAFRQGDTAIDRRLFRCVEPPPFQSLHSALIPLLLTRSIGVADAGGELAYTVTAQEEAWARDMLGAVLPSRSSPLLGMQIASFPTKGYRDWPLGHFGDLCERILKRWPIAHVMIFGGSLERGRAEQLAGRFPSRSTSVAGKLSLRETAALMNSLDLYVGVDTGPTHVMGALHRPMVALYHCYSPSRLLMPLGHPCFYPVDHPRAAQGCGPATSMAEITVDSVWTRVLEALTAHAPHPAGSRASS